MPILSLYQLEQKAKVEVVDKPLNVYKGAPVSKRYIMYLLVLSFIILAFGLTFLAPAMSNVIPPYAIVAIFVFLIASVAVPFILQEAYMYYQTKNQKMNILFLGYAFIFVILTLVFGVLFKGLGLFITLGVALTILPAIYLLKNKQRNIYNTDLLQYRPQSAIFGLIFVFDSVMYTVIPLNTDFVLLTTLLSVVAFLVSSCLYKPSRHYLPNLFLELFPIREDK
jgi:hypothetical protein